MTPRLKTSLMTTALTGAAVSCVSVLIAGSEGLFYGVSATLIAMLIALATLVCDRLACSVHPVSRHGLVMMLRSALAMAAFAVAVVAGADARLLLLVTAPLYFALLAAEVTDALQQTTQDAQAAGALPRGTHTD